MTVVGTHPREMIIGSFSEHGDRQPFLFAHKSSFMAEVEQNMSVYLDVLLETFKPAPSVDTATHFFTTQEIYDAIKELDPGSTIKLNQVFRTMQDAGFAFKQRPGTTGLDFRWILVYK